jgi:hypothetical protein
VDLALALPAGSTTYIGDSLFIVENEQQSGVTLIAHIKTGVQLSSSDATMPQVERSELFKRLQYSLSNAVSNGSLLQSFLSQTTLKSASFGKSITSINLAVVPSSSSSKPEPSLYSYLGSVLEMLQPFGMQSLYARSNLSSIHVSVAVVVCLLLLLVGLLLVVSLAGRLQPKKLPPPAIVKTEELTQKPSGN